MSGVTFRVDGLPTSWNQLTRSHSQMIALRKKADAAVMDVAILQARRSGAWPGHCLAGPLRCTVTVHPATRQRRDLDNLAIKAWIDQLRQRGVIADDHAGIIAELVIRRGVMARPAWTAVCLDPLPDPVDKEDPDEPH